MAFDLSTARPVQGQKKGGFDLSTAKPVQSAQSTTQPANAEDRVPPSLRGEIPFSSDTNPIKQTLQGMSLGFADELGSAAAALAAKVRDPQGVDLREAYTDIRDTVRSQDDAYRQENPGKALAFNVLGGGLTAAPVFNSLRGATVAGGISGAGYSNETTPGGLAIDTAIGATAGAVLQKALQLGGNYVQTKIAQRGGMANLLDETGQIKPDIIDAVEEGVASGRIAVDEATQTIDELQGSLSPEAMRRYNLFKQRGVTPLRANITQATDDFRQLQDGVKQSGKLAETVAEQDEQMIGAVRQGIDDIAPRATNVQETNANVFNVVDSITGEYEDVVTAAYKTARESLSGQKNVRYSNLLNRLRENIGNETKSGGIISSIRQELKNRGIMSKGWADDRLTDVETAEGIRQALNKLYDKKQPFGNMVIRDLKEALDEDVAAAAGPDAFKGARAANVRLKTLIQRSRRDARDTTNGGFLEDVLNNKIPEEKIVPRLLTGRDDDFLKFKQFLLEDAGEGGAQAWNDVKAHVLRDALESATSTMGKGEKGQILFNSRLFANRLNNLKATKKYNSLFSAQEQKMIEDITEIGWLRVPQRSVQSGSGPTGFAVNELRRDILNRLDGSGGLIERVLGYAGSRSAESAQLNPLKQTAKAMATKPPLKTPSKQ
jgi:gas vesicle protein